MNFFLILSMLCICLCALLSTPFTTHLAELVAVVGLVDKDVREKVVHQLSQRRMLGEILTVLRRQLR